MTSPPQKNGQTPQVHIELSSGTHLRSDDLFNSGSNQGIGES